MPREATATISLNPLERQIQINGEPIQLGRDEYQLIEELAVTPTIGVSYREIAVRLSSIRGPVTTNQVKATATAVRRKLRAAGIRNPLPEIDGIGLRLLHL